MAEIMINRVPPQFRPAPQKADDGNAYRPIEIAAAPPEYQAFMIMSDANRNGRIDSDTEMENSIDAYRRDHSAEETDHFIRYLVNATGREAFYEKIEGETYHKQGRGQNKLRLILTLNPFSFGVSPGRYRGFPDDMRYTPPHPDDPGAETAPVNFRGDDNWYTASAQLSLDVFQDFTLNYEYLYYLGAKKNEQNNPKDYAGCYHPNDPSFPFQCGLGPNATFIAIERKDSHFVTVGLFPFVSEKSGQGLQFSLPVEAGLAVTRQKYTSGWDRLGGEPQVHQSRSETKVGLTAALHLRFLGSDDPKKSNLVAGLGIAFAGIRFEYYGPKDFAISLTPFSFSLGSNL
jgi:hypothetical protein